MSLTVSNHNGTLIIFESENLLQKFCTPQISSDRNLTFIDHVLSLLLGVRVFTRIPAGIRNRCIGLTCCNLMHEITPFRLPTCIKLYVYEEYK